MNLRELARLQKRQRRKAERQKDPAELPEHLQRQAERIEQGYGYPAAPDMPGSPGRRPVR